MSKRRSGKRKKSRANRDQDETALLISYEPEIDDDVIAVETPRIPKAPKTAKDFFIMLTTYLGVSFFLLILFSLPATCYIMGVMYKDQCTTAPFIPSYLKVLGMLSCIKLFMEISARAQEYFDFKWCNNKLEKFETKLNSARDKVQEAQKNLQGRVEKIQKNIQENVDKAKAKVGDIQQTLQNTAGKLPKDLGGVADISGINVNVNNIPGNFPEIPGMSGLPAGIPEIPEIPNPMDKLRAFMKYISEKGEETTNVFLTAWFIPGNVAIYTVYEPDYYNVHSPYYCHPTLYQFAFWLVTSLYIVAVTLVFLVSVYLMYLYLRDKCGLDTGPTRGFS